MANTREIGTAVGSSKTKQAPKEFYDALNTTLVMSDPVLVSVNGELVVIDRSTPPTNYRGSVEMTDLKNRIAAWRKQNVTGTNASPSQIGKFAPKPSQELIDRRFVLVGDGRHAVDFMCRYVDDTYSDDCISRIGIDYKCKITKVANHDVRVQLRYVEDANFVRELQNGRRPLHLFIVIDVTRSDSIDRLGKIMRDIKPYYESIGDSITLLGATENSAYNSDTAKEFLDTLCSAHGIEKRFIVNAKENIGIEEAVTETIKLCFPKQDELSAPRAATEPMCNLL